MPTSDFRAECIVLLFAVSSGDQPLLLELATFGYSVATQIVVVLNVAFPDQLALAISLVFGVSGHAVFTGFQYPRGSGG